MNSQKETGEHRCQHCGAPLSRDSADELCLRCALGNALEPPAQSSEAPFASAASGEAHAKPGHPFLRSFGDYELLEEIARGGMGVVYRARQVSLDRIVAVKMILFGPLASAEQVRRFRTEASAAGCLQHPNIVAIHEVGLHEKQHYLAMDYVDGPNLGRLVHQGPLSAKRAAGYVKVIAEAVHYAHERGILHRDLKPSNVLIDSDDRPRVVDFGLAKRFTADSSLTLSGQVLGSPSYMPPEQAGAGQVKVGRHSDVYSLGAILYHLLTGRPPFQAETVPQTLNLVTNAEVLSPRVLNPTLPRDLETICLKCLEKEPSKRYQTGQALANELGRLLSDEPIVARPVNAPEKFWRWCRRKPAVASLAAVLGLVFLLGFAGVVSQWRRAEQSAAELRRHSYAGDMNLAQAALKASNLRQAKDLLERHRPRPDESDLRNWEWRYLWQHCQTDALFALAQDHHLVFSLSFSSNGKWLAAGGLLGEVTIWDTTGRRIVKTLQERGQSACVAFSPDGNWLAATAQKGVVTLWQTSSWSDSIQLNHGGVIRSLAFSPDSKRLVLFGVDRKVSVWNLEGSNQFTSFRVSAPRTDHHGVVAVSPNNQWLAVGETDGRIRVLALATLTEQFSFPGPSEGVTALAFSPDSKLLASGSGLIDSTVRIWSLDFPTGARRLEGHAAWVRGLAFSPDGKLLASASADQTVRLWNAQTWLEVAALRGHRQEVWAVAFAADGRTLASGDKNGAIYIWSSEKRSKTVRCVTLPKVVREASFSPVGTNLATLNGDGTVSLWDLKSFHESGQITEAGSNNTGVMFAPKGQLLAVGDRSGAIKLIDLVKRAEPRKLVWRQPAPVHPVKFTKDGRFLLGLVRVPPADNCAVWAVDSGKEVVAWPLPLEVISVDLSPDGRIAVGGSRDGTVRFWETSTAHELVRFTAHKYHVSSVAFSPDGKLVATTSAQGDAGLWDAVLRRRLGNLQGHLLAIHAMTFSPDGRRIATGGDGHEAIKLWDVATRRELATLESQGSRFNGVRFSPDGNSLLAVNDAGTLHLWRAPSFAEIDVAESRQP